MTSIGTAETAEDAEVATSQPSANSAVSAVIPAFGPRILRKKRPGIFHRRIARFIAAVVADSKSPNPVATAQRGGWACDFGRGFCAPAGLVDRKTGSCAPPAWLTSDVAKKMEGRPIVTDSNAQSADPSLPAFLARPVGAPVYHGFAVVEESETDGWRYGAITAFEGVENEEAGDGFVIAPDGTRAGVVWSVDDPSFEVISPPEEGRW